MLLSLPIIRNYALFGRGDVMTHVGYIKDILNAGYIVSYEISSRSNIYPMHHILALCFSLITNISLQRITMVIPIIFSLFFVFAYYLMIKKFSNENLLTIRVILVFSALLLFGPQHSFFAPNVLSFFYIPLVMYVWIKTDTTSNITNIECLIILMFIFITFFHPLTSLYLALILILFELSRAMLKNSINFKRLSIMLAVLFTIWLSWYFSFSFMLSEFKLVLFSILFREGDNPLYIQYKTTLLSQKLSVIDIILAGIHKFGSLLILGIISLVYLLYFVMKMPNGKGKYVQHWQLFSILGFVFFSIWAIFNMFIFMVSFTRVFKFILFFSIMLSGSLTRHILKRRRKKTFYSVGVIVFLLLLDYTVVFTLYPSPLSRDPNPQVTYAEFMGMEFFLEKRHEDFKVYAYALTPMRFCHAILGVKDKRCYRGIQSNTVDTRPEAHFGYHTGRPLGDRYNMNIYLILNDLGRMLYKEILPDYKEYWRYYPEDFIKLNTDSTVSKFYDNHDLTVYLVHRVRER